MWAKSFNGDYYRGQVTALSEKVYIKFENGDTIAHDRYCLRCVVGLFDPVGFSSNGGKPLELHPQFVSYCIGPGASMQRTF